VICFGKEVINLVAVHDNANQFWINQEKEIGEKIRKNRDLEKSDLKRIIEWKFESDARLKTIEMNRIANIREKDLLNGMSNFCRLI